MHHRYQEELTVSAIADETTVEAYLHRIEQTQEAGELVNVFDFSPALILFVAALKAGVSSQEIAVLSKELQVNVMVYQQARPGQDPLVYPFDTSFGGSKRPLNKNI